MKKTNIARLSALALTLCLVSTALMSGTMAKYTKTVTGEATATVAKFEFGIGEDTKQTETIDLTKLFSNTYNDGLVTANADKKVVAPGTSGVVNLSVANNGEVAIKPTFTLTETNAGSIPLEYAVTNSDTAPAEDVNWKTAGNDGIVNTGFTGDNIAVGENSQQTVYLHWRWKTTSDAADTVLGEAGTAKVSLKIECTVEQVLPTAPAN